MDLQQWQAELHSHQQGLAEQQPDLDFEGCQVPDVELLEAATPDADMIATGGSASMIATGGSASVAYLAPLSATCCDVELAADLCDAAPVAAASVLHAQQMQPAKEQHAGVTHGWQPEPLWLPAIWQMGHCSTELASSSAAGHTDCPEPTWAGSCRMFSNQAAESENYQYGLEADAAVHSTTCSCSSTADLEAARAAAACIGNVTVAQQQEQWVEVKAEDGAVGTQPEAATGAISSTVAVSGAGLASKATHCSFQAVSQGAPARTRAAASSQAAFVHRLACGKCAAACESW